MTTIIHYRFSFRRKYAKKRKHVSFKPEPPTKKKGLFTLFHISWLQVADTASASRQPTTKTVIISGEINHQVRGRFAGKGQRI